MSFSTTFAIRWADLDPNGHVRHSVYADLAAQTRVDWLTSLGFGLREFGALGLGPILFREETRYLREVHLHDEVTVVAEVSGLSEDGTKWSLVHTLRRADGTVVALISVDGAWFDLRTRRVTAPPPALADTMRQAPRHESYADIVRGSESR